MIAPVIRATCSSSSAHGVLSGGRYGPSNRQQQTFSQPRTADALDQRWL